MNKEGKMLDKKSRYSLSIGLVKYGVVGFLVLAPAIIGAIIGNRLDSPESNTWTVTLLVAGLLIGIFGTVLWLRKEIKKDEKT